MILLAQASSTDTTEPERPITDWLVELFGLDDSSTALNLFGSIIEPILQIILISLLAFIANRIIRWVIHRLIESAEKDEVVSSLGQSLSFGEEEVPVTSRRRQRLDALEAVLRSITTIIVWTFAVFAILGWTFGISLAPLIAGAGVLGLAFSFGAQDLVSDFLSGMFMLAEDQFGVGDIVDVGDATGLVERVGLRSTRLRDVTGVVWHVPNGEIRRIGNLSQDWSRALLDVGIAYGADIDEAMAVIKRAADDVAADEAFAPVFLGEPEIWGVEELANSSVLIRLVVKTTPGDQWPVARELRRRIKYALDDAAIEIPFPQRTVWLRPDGEASGEAAGLDDGTVDRSRVLPEQEADDGGDVVG